MVAWDRFAHGDDWYAVVYGWIPRDDGRSDFVLLASYTEEESNLLVRDILGAVFARDYAAAHWQRRRPR